MESLEERRRCVLDNLENITVDPPKTGGQSCGIFPSYVNIHSDILGVTI